MRKQAGYAVLLILGLLAPWPLAAQCPDGTPPPCARWTPSAHSVAVLPLENRARDTSLVLLAEGLADQITTNLAQMERIAVAPPASVRFVLGRGPREPGRLAHTLNVRWLVDGQFLPGAGSVRVSVQLIDATTLRVRWSAAFQRPTDDIFAVITAVADSVATAVVGALAPDERARLARRPTASNAAALAYARGLAALHHQDPPSLRTAMAEFEEAIAADSAFAAAWAGLAEAWMQQDVWEPPRVVYPRARAAAERALAVDPSSAAAAAALASVALYFDWDPPRAESLARRALQLDSTRGRAWEYLGEALAAQGRLDAGALAMHRAIAADTLDEPVLSKASIGLGLVRRPDEALAVVRRWRRLAPDELNWDFAEALLLVGAHRCAAEPPRQPRTPIALACAGQHDAARALVDSAIARRERGEESVSAGLLAVFEVALGDRDAALRWFARAIDERTLIPVFAAMDPLWDGLRGDPRFNELLQRVRPAERPMSGGGVR
jgi:TolB-like protein/tetratricopeptide (TPR) repeat protein